jgi:hypothetical protein
VTGSSREQLVSQGKCNVEAGQLQANAKLQTKVWCTWMSICPGDPSSIH